MQFWQRPLFIRNVATASVNGLITLVILLIAPLGLFAVILNTALVTLSTYTVCTLGDSVMRWLSETRSPEQLRHRNELRKRSWEER